MVKNDLKEQDRQEASRQDQACRRNVGELDSCPSAVKLVIDELLVIKQLAVGLRLRPESHVASSSRDTD